MKKILKFHGCTLKSLPPELLIPAAQTARTINPFNDPHIPGLAQLRALWGSASRENEPQHIAMVTSKYWGAGPLKFTVGFKEKTDQPLVDKILRAMNLWQKTCNVEFVHTTDYASAMVRISRDKGGYYSYLGTDILHIPKNQHTMNLEGFRLSTPDSEYIRVITHETGHTLGCPHEHMRQDLVALLDPTRTIAYFKRTQGWTEDEVRAQVLTSLNEQDIMGTPVDQTSIMCYQIPGECTRSGKPIPGGSIINDSDFAFMGTKFPKKEVPPVNPPSGKKYRYVLESDSPVAFQAQP